jgi:hypothetical protein
MVAVAPQIFEGMVWELAKVLGLSEDPDNWEWIHNQGTYIHFFKDETVIIYRQLRDADWENGITWKFELIAS